MRNKPQEKKTEPQTEEKIDAQKKEQIKISSGVKKELDKLPGDTYEDKIRGLLVKKMADDIPEDGKVLLKMEPKNFRTLLLVLSDTPAVARLLTEAKVT